MSKPTNESSGNSGARKSDNSRMGAGCLILFAVPFAAFGLFALGWTVRDVWRHQQVQSWQATPATLLAAKLESHQASKGGVTYLATARYRYDFAGKTYESERVALHDKSDNVGDYQKRRGTELEGLLRTAKPVTAYVNPDDPSQAILFRDLRPLLIATAALFGLVFSCVGFGLIAAAIWLNTDIRREEQLQQQFPDEPWLWKQKWHANRLRPSRQLFWGMLIFGGFWNLMAWPAFLQAAFDGDATWSTKLIVMLFPAVGLGLAGYATYLWLQQRKWGVSELELATKPGVLGGPLAGMIDVPRAIETTQGITLRLACIRKEKKGKSTTEIPLWEEEHAINRNLSTADRRTLLPVQFVIPYDLPDSNAEDITWKLSARARTTGVDYYAEFEVPVFRTAASSKAPTAVVLEDGELYAPVTLAVIAQGASAVIEEEQRDRATLYFPRARHLGLAIFSGVFALVWGGACVGFFLSDASILFAGFFLVVALIVFPYAFAAIFESTRLEFGARGVRVARRIAGFGKERRFAPEEIAAIEAVKSGMTFGSTVYWNVELRDRQQRRHKLATAIPQRRYAERLAEQMAAMVGLSPSGRQSAGSPSELAGELPRELRVEQR